MTERSVTHSTFVIERTYPVPPARVFAAWAAPEAKKRWFGGGDGWTNYALDFKVGGHERGMGGPPGEKVYAYDAQYQEIVPNERIVYSYTMDRHQTRISVSVTTVEFKAAGTQTQLVYTEHGAYLDGGDKPEFREMGTKALLDSLGSALKGE